MFATKKKTHSANININRWTWSAEPLFAGFKPNSVWASFHFYTWHNIHPLFWIISMMIIDWNWLNTLKPGKKFFVFVIDDLRDFALWTLFIKCCLEETVKQISRMLTIRISSVPQINVSTISIDSVQSSWQNFPGTVQNRKVESFKDWCVGQMMMESVLM